MPKPKLIRTRILPYHVYARSNNKDWFYLPTQEMWWLFVNMWKRVCEKFEVQLHIYVMMSNHFHVLMTTPQANIDEAMLYFMRETAREVNRRTDRINHVFGGPYQSSVIQSTIHYRNIYKYVARNPVEAGICDRVETYKFSSLWLRNNETIPLYRSIFEPHRLPDVPPLDDLEWLNEPEEKELRDCIRKGLRKGYFEVRKSNVSRMTREKLEGGLTKRT